MMMLPDFEVFGEDIFDEFDGGIYDSNWNFEPDLEYLMQAGDLILWPPGYMHETLSTSQSDCTSSMTFQLPKSSIAARYLRAFTPRLAMSRELGTCRNEWEPFVNLSPTKKLSLGKKEILLEDAFERLQKLVKRRAQVLALLAIV